MILLLEKIKLDKIHKFFIMFLCYDQNVKSDPKFPRIPSKISDKLKIKFVLNLPKIGSCRAQLRV